MKRRPSRRTLERGSARLELEIGPMSERDLNQIMRLERVCFSAPWSRRMFREELEHPWAVVEVARLLDTNLGFEEIDRSLVGTLPAGGFAGQAPVIGYLDYWLVHEEVHLLSVAVHPGLRKLGLGRLLVERALEATRFIAGRRVSLEVRRSNLPAQKLYKSLGFEVTAIHKGYYRESGEDALIMKLELPSQPGLDPTGSTRSER